MIVSYTQQQETADNTKELNYDDFYMIPGLYMIPDMTKEKAE